MHQTPVYSIGEVLLYFLDHRRDCTRLYVVLHHESVHLAKNYGVIYLGFGIGSICGSIIASLFGGFYVTFYVIFALLILSLALSTTIRQPEQKMLREAHGSL